MCSWQLAPGTNTDMYVNDCLFFLFCLLLLNNSCSMFLFSSIILIIINNKYRIYLEVLLPSC